MAGVRGALALALVMAGSAAGCGAESSDETRRTARAADLAGRSFVVTEVDDPRRDVVPGSTIRLDFTGDSISVQAGCNNIGGAYEVVDATLVVDQLAGTERGCDPPLMAQDAWVTAFLAARPGVALEGQDLALATGGTTLRLGEQVLDTPPLEGTPWRLSSLVEGDGDGDAAVSSVPGGAADGSLVVEGGTLTVRYGCTTVTAPVELGPAQLRTGEVTVVARDCAPRLPELERHVQQVLGPETAYVVTGRNLMLSSADGSRGLGFVAP